MPSDLDSENSVPLEPILVKKIVANWLTRKPHPNSFIVAAAALFMLSFVSLIFWTDYLSSSEWITAIPEKVFQEHQYWRLLTALFTHEDFGHLLSNSILFFTFSYFLYGYFGSFVFPLAAFFFGGITNLIVLSQMPPTNQLIGASGIVYWMGAVWLTLYFFIDSRYSKSKRLIKSVAISLILFIPESYKQNVSYLSHFVGYVLGVLFAVAYYHWHKQKFLNAEVTEITIETE